MAMRTLEKPRGGRPGIPIRGDGWDGRRRGDGNDGAPRIGVWVLLAAITMLFVGFTATYLTRRTAADWAAFPAPPILWATTAILLVSSAALEWARRRLRQGDLAALRRGLLWATLLGVAFVAGQVLAWRELAAAGIFLATNPHSAFFYLLTGAHAVHVLGGLAALGVALAAAWRGRGGGVDATATYWHFLGALWLYLFVILFVL